MWIFSYFRSFLALKENRQDSWRQTVTDALRRGLTELLIEKNIFPFLDGREKKEKGIEKTPVAQNSL
uniref:Uncharacterized protein n=1 Tax=Anguilla anguilla TaxID=7936 RepID=A0A0E9TI07_ANGAN